MLQRSCWEAMDLSQLPSDVGKMLDRSWGFSRFLCQMEQEKDKLETPGRAVRSWPCPGHVAWAGLGPGMDGAALEPGVLRGWRLLGEGNPAKMVLFILQRKLDARKNGIF